MRIIAFPGRNWGLAEQRSAFQHLHAEPKGNSGQPSQHCCMNFELRNIGLMIEQFSIQPFFRAISQCCLISLCCGNPLTNAQEPADTNYDEAKVPTYTLPPLIAAGTVATTDADRAKVWKDKRRAEVQSLLEQSVYGRTPDAPTSIRSELLEASDAALGGIAHRRQYLITVSPALQALGLDPSRSIQIEVLIYTPKASRQNGADSQAHFPAFMGLNFYGNQTISPDPAIRLSTAWMRGNAEIGIVDNRATAATRGVYQNRWQVETVIKRGYGLVTVYCGDMDPDNYWHDFSDGVHPLFYTDGQTQPADDQWGAIGAWAWGLSTIRNWLATTPDSGIDAKRIAVIGHSRLGKTALWAGAQDQNFAMVISNNSGCRGAALYRRCYGERIHHMLRPVGYWFCRNHAKYAKREHQLPVDQHMLMALVAPRPLYVASAEADRWADPKGEFLAAVHASPVYRWMGIEGLPTTEMPKPNQPVAGRIGYHIRSGQHDVTLFDWEQYLDFADTYL